jgi:hypothetical protein
MLARSGSLEGMMKRLAMAAFLLLVVTAARTEAGPLPQPKSRVGQEKTSNLSHSVRGNRAKLPQPAQRVGDAAYGGLRLSHGVRGN